MKKVTITIAMAVVAIAAGVAIIACGGTKQVAQAPPGATEQSENICERLQSEAPAKRATGKGTHFKEMTARNIAERQARAAFVRAISSVIKTSTSEDALGYDIYSGDATTGNAATDQGSKSNDFAQGVAEGIVANTVIIKTYKVLLANKQYEYWVCLEYQGDVAQLATTIAKKVEQKIPDEQKHKMNFEFEQYRKRVEAEFEKSK
jgi:hypothetical protein